MNLPNILSLFRLCLVPLFILAYFSKIEGSVLLAVTIFVVAAITDILDGMIARRFNKTSNLGKILDPLGDKMMTISVLACITIDRIIPFWAVMVLLVKECLMGLGGFYLYQKRSFMPPSNFFGKSSTVVFFLACVILLLFRDLPKPWPTIIISVAIAVMAAAFVNYFVIFIKLITRKQVAPENEGHSDGERPADAG